MTETRGSPRPVDPAGEALPAALARWWAAWEGRTECRRLVVGVSGGADSMALLHALRAAPFLQHLELIVAHLDHGLRGAVGAADRRFVAAQARRLGLRYRTARRTVGSRAGRVGVSMEMAARSARYAFFRRVVHAVGADAVAVGHTRDDQAETLLLRLARGTGPTGLGGMAPDSERDGMRIVRPLLEVSRKEVIAFLRAHRWRWREDATNADPTPLRNRIRLDLMPRLCRAIQPTAPEAMARAATHVREQNRFVDALALREYEPCQTTDGAGLAVPRFRTLDPVLRFHVWRRWLLEHRVPGERIDTSLLDRAERLLESEAGSAWIPLPGGGRLERRYGVLHVCRTSTRMAPPEPIPISVPGVTEAPRLGWKIEARWATGFHRTRDVGFPPPVASCALSRAQADGARFLLRGWQPGDRIAPVGMTGTRKLQDILGEARVPRSQRARVPVVLCGREVVWLPGYRIARRWAVPAPEAPALWLQATFSGGWTAGCR